MDGILKFPIARLFKNLHHDSQRSERIRVVDYLPTDLISGTNFGSRIAYETLL